MQASTAHRADPYRGGLRDFAQVLELRRVAGVGSEALWHLTFKSGRITEMRGEVSIHGAARQGLHLKSCTATPPLSILQVDARGRLALTHEAVLREPPRTLGRDEPHVRWLLLEPDGPDALRGVAGHTARPTRRASDTLTCAAQFCRGVGESEDEMGESSSTGGGLADESEDELDDLRYDSDEDCPFAAAKAGKTLRPLRAFRSAPVKCLTCFPRGKPLPLGAKHVVCSGCKLVVCSACFGMKTPPDASWYCDACRRGE
jgi:hypothetical protein